MVAIVHDSSFADDLGTVGIRDDYGRWLFQLSDSHRVAVIKVLMCHEDVVSFGIGTVIRRRLQATHRVHFYLSSVKRDADAAMFDGGKDNLFAAPVLNVSVWTASFCKVLFFPVQAAKAIVAIRSNMVSNIFFFISIQFY